MMSGLTAASSLTPASRLSIIARVRWSWLSSAPGTPPPESMRWKCSDTPVGASAIISGSTVGLPGGTMKPSRARHPIIAYLRLDWPRRHVSIGRFAERDIVRGCGMAFSLIDDEAGAVPVELISKAGFSRWLETAGSREGDVISKAGFSGGLETAGSRERDWAASVGFAAEAGKLALVPDADGRLGRGLGGMGHDDAGGGAGGRQGRRGGGGGGRRRAAACTAARPLPPRHAARRCRSEPGGTRVGARHL